MFKILSYIAMKNLLRRLKFFITVTLCVFIASFSAVLALSIYDVINSGIELSSQRQGADILVYPHGIDVSDTSMIYSGVAQSVYMNEGITDKLITDDVEAVTEQFFLQTLPAAGCCAVEYEYRLVGIDWETDFIVKPWVANKDLTGLEKGEMIVGSAVAGEFMENTFILNNLFKIVSVLEPTGTSLDYSLFFNFDQLRTMAKVNFPQSYFDNIQPSEAITSTLVKLKDGVNPQSYIASLKDIDAKVISTSMVEDGIKGEVNTLSSIVAFLIIIILVLCCVTLASQFRMLTLSRCKEIGYLRGIGMGKVHIFTLFIMEFGVISLIGGISGSIVGTVAFLPAIEWIKQSISLPMGLCDTQFMVMHALIGVALAIVLCIISTVMPLINITSISPHDAITKGEI